MKKLNQLRFPKYGMLLAWEYSIICVILLTCTSVFSRNTQTAVTNTAPQNHQKILRDPFWPVGYFPEEWGMNPAEKKKADEENKRKAISGKDWDIAIKKITINGICKTEDGELYAVINNQVKSIGELVAVDTKDQRYYWKIIDIQPPRNVKLQRVKAEKK